ncbi:MAG: GWxTD domain-containing protein [Thermoanaerobaculia bacterium]
MKMFRRFLAVAALAGIAAAPALAALDKYKDWDKGPEFLYFGTDEEKAAIKKLATDDEAARFIALFWARRDPDLKTPQNEFKDRVEALVKIADQQFVMRGKRGALTQRGRILIILGPPKQIIPRDVSSAAGPESTGADIQMVGAKIIQYTFLYKDDRIPAFADQKMFEIVVVVDQTLGTETLERAGQLATLQRKAVQAYLANPALKELPVYKTREQVEAEQKTTAEAAKGPSLTPAIRTALEEALARPPSGPLSVMPIAFRDGATRLMTQVTVPAATVTAPETTKLALIVRDKEGKDAARIEEAAGLEKSKNFLFANRAIALRPGDYDVAAALLNAAGGVIAIGRRAATVSTVPTEFVASGLFVGNDDLPGDPKRLEEAFAFSGRRFVAPPEAKFDVKDGLCYAIRIYNPPVDPVTKTTFIKRSLRIKPKTGSAIDVPGIEEKPTPVPDLKDAGTLILDLAGVIVEENLGDYFRPGDYELRLTVADQGSGKKLEASAPFTLTGNPKPAPPAGPKK